MNGSLDVKGVWNKKIGPLEHYVCRCCGLKILLAQTRSNPSQRFYS